MLRDNIPGVRIDRPWKFLLIPGLVFQWLLYMNPKSGHVVRSTRRARSPIMTYAYSFMFWVGGGWLTASAILNGPADTLPQGAPVHLDVPAARADEIDNGKIALGEMTDEADVGVEQAIAPDPLAALPESQNQEMATPVCEGELADAPAQMCPEQYSEIAEAITQSLASGTPARWHVGAHSGYAVASTLQEGGAQPCRTYFYTVTGEGRTWQSPNSTACEEQPGVWR